MVCLHISWKYFWGYSNSNDDFRIHFSSFLWLLQAGGGGAGGKVAKVDDLEKIDIKKEAEAGRVSL